MNSQMVIKADRKNNRLLIECPLWANDLVRSLPSRRWVKGARAWAVPVIRRNIEGIMEFGKYGGGVEIQPDAKAMIDEYQQAVDSSGTRGEGFPAWYPFKTQPRKHQARALDKCYGLKAAGLFMDMQTGKSKTAIDLVTCHRMEGHIHGVLVLVKLSLRGNWREQFEIHCPIDHSIHFPETGAAGIKKFERWLGSKHDFKVMVVGWESLSAGGMVGICERFLVHTLKSAIIGDESTYIAGHKATRSEAAVKLARMAEYRYALTGTPTTEGPMNLFMQFEFLDPNIIGIGDFYAFRNRYAVMGGYVPKEGRGAGKPTQIVGYQNMDELMETIGPHIFQVMKSEAYDLPPKRYEVRSVPLSAEQRRIYDDIKKNNVIRVTADVEKAVQNALELSLRLHQVAGGYTVKPREEIRTKLTGEKTVKVVYDPVEIVTPAKNPKVIEVMSILEEMKGRHQGVLWAVYQPEIQALVWAAKHMGFRIGELHGKVPEEERHPMVKRFREGDIDLIIGNAGTGGMGFTMMTSQVNIFYNNTFKYIDRAQAEDRAYGDGQEGNPCWIDIIAEKTVDLPIKRALDDKQDLATYIKGRIKEIQRVLDGE